MPVVLFASVQAMPQWSVCKSLRMQVAIVGAAVKDCTCHSYAVWQTQSRFQEAEA